ncbi:MAG: CDP-alcohol phosphatidyltransferase family protein [Pirellulales bacterium]|nr:CDP-alcohol phosphatidyltransferase family protein [Pirellulales bacterium]
MKQLPFPEFERRCQKPDHRRLGNWMARHISRPAALRITRVVAPWGVSAHAATLATWGVGIAAAAAFGWGTLWGWVLGAAMLQVWYLLDHVDGQLARLRGTASLDGVQLDYLMHHTVNLVVPLGVGGGLYAQTGEPLWPYVGLLWGLSLLLISLQHDTRYKAFTQRLERVRGHLLVCGGGGGRPEPQPPIPRRPLRLAAWTARKACEIHVILNLLALVAIGQLLLGDRTLTLGRIYLGLAAPIALAVTAWTLGRSLHRGSVEQEFMAWYRVPPGCELVFDEGWWIVQSAQGRESADFGKIPDATGQQSS